MTNEEIERAIDFLLKSQANGEARIEQTNLQLDRLTEKVDQLAVQLGAFADTRAELMRVMTRTFEAQAHINESLRRSIDEVAARQAQTEVALTNLTQKVEVLADAQVNTNHRLDDLIKIVGEERGR